MKAAGATPDAAVLFDSTIREPTDLLAGVVRRAFEGGITDRYESVFAEGNRFAVGAVAARYGVPPEQVIGTTGATSALALTLKALVGPGDEVLIEHPRFDLLPALARDAGATVADLPRRAPDYRVDPDELAALIKPNTRLIVLTQVHNPTGAVLDGPRPARRSARWPARPACRCWSTRPMLATFVGEGVSAVQYGPEFISVGSLTKVQGLFALKCGWAVAAPEVISRIQAASPQGDLGVSKLAHAVAALVLEDRAPFDAHWRDILAGARPVVEEHVDGYGRRPACWRATCRKRAACYFPKVVGDRRHPGVGPLAVVGAWGGWWRPASSSARPGHVRIGFGGGRLEALDRGFDAAARGAEILSARTMTR